MYITLEVDTHTLPAWTLTGREADDRVQITTGKLVGWIHKTSLAPLLFPSTLTFAIPCRGCRTTVTVCVETKEAVKALTGVLCRTCAIMEDQVHSGMQTIGPKR